MAGEDHLNVGQWNGYSTNSHRKT